MKVTPVEKKFGSYKPGDVFDLEDKAAAIMIRVGKLRCADMRAESVEAPESPEISARTGKPKRQYRRRDLRAED